MAAGEAGACDIWLRVRLAHAMGPLDALEPLIAAGEAFSALLKFALGLLFLIGLAPPTLLLFLASPPATGWWRWPVLWPVVPFATVFVVLLPAAHEVQGGNHHSSTWIALAAYAAWAVLVTAVGTLQLLARTARFVFVPQQPAAPLSGAHRALYGWGAVCVAASSAIAALIGHGPAFLWQLLFAVSFGLLGGFVLRRETTQRTPLPRAAVFARLCWLFGSWLLAVTTPAAAVLVVACFTLGVGDLDRGVPRGVPLAVIAVLVCAAAVWMVRASRPRSASPQLHAQ